MGFQLNTKTKIYEGIIPVLEYLKKNKFITISDESKNTPQHSLVESSAGRVEILPKGNKIKDLNLILRNGDIINELRNEVAIYR